MIAVDTEKELTVILNSLSAVAPSVFVALTVKVEVVLDATDVAIPVIVPFELNVKPVDILPDVIAYVTELLELDVATTGSVIIPSSVFLL